MNYDSTHLDAVRKIIQIMGGDPNCDESLIDTPARVLNAWKELFAGAFVSDDDVENMLKTFENPDYDEMIVQRGIRFTSFCEHHLLPFTGVAHVGYIPGGRIVGLSKLARIVDVYSKRLQVQERMTVQITSALSRHIPHIKGAGCVVEAFHSCVACRGVRKEGAEMVTSSLVGCLRASDASRAEFFRLCGL